MRLTTFFWGFIDFFWGLRAGDRPETVAPSLIASRPPHQARGSESRGGIADLVDERAISAWGVDRAALVRDVVKAAATCIFEDGLFNADPVRAEAVYRSLSRALLLYFS